MPPVSVSQTWPLTVFISSFVPPMPATSARGGEVLRQPPVPVGVGDDVVVEEGDPGGARGPPAQVPGAGRAATAGADDPQRRKAGAVPVGAGRRGAVVDQDELEGAALPRRPARRAGRQRGPADGRHHDVHPQDIQHGGPCPNVYGRKHYGLEVSESGHRSRTSRTRPSPEGGAQFQRGSRAAADTRRERVGTTAASSPSRC